MEERLCKTSGWLETKLGNIFSYNPKLGNIFSYNPNPEFSRYTSLMVKQTCAKEKKTHAKPFTIFNFRFSSF